MSAERAPGRRRDGAQPVRVWIDIENPPQVQYLVPLVRAFERRGADVRVTARDYGFTFDLLREQGVDFDAVGRHYGASKRAKVIGTIRRVRALRRLLSEKGRPDVVVSASRSASLTARSLGIPSCALCDYEYVNLFTFRLAKTYVVHPDVISTESFRKRGMSPARLIAYHGIKEDITFADVDVETIAPWPLPDLPAGRLKVLVRPPAEESHYHRAESTELARSALERFASDESLVVVFSPRYEWQVDAVKSLEWATPPHVLEGAAPFVPLLKAVDVVVSGGGTMTREAAYLGTPAVSIFQGLVGDVDRYLAREGRLTIVRSRDELDRLRLEQLSATKPLYTNRAAAEDITDAVLDVLEGRSQRRLRDDSIARSKSVA